MDAGWLAACGEASITHVTLADNAALRVVLRHAVGAVPGAVLAADASMGAVLHNASEGIFRESLDWAADQARRLETVVAAHRQMKAIGVGIPTALDFADAAPVDVCWISVLLIAGDDAALAPDALGHVEVETILLT